MESGVTASFKNTAASNHHEVHTHSLPMARELLRRRLHLCREQGLYGRPAWPKRLVGRGWPKLGAAWGILWR